MTAKIGSLEPMAAWEYLQTHPEAILFDVRTPEEWRETGIPDLSDDGEIPRPTHLLSWPKEPSPEARQTFAEGLQRAAPEINNPVLFICRSGVRSQKAAELAHQLGYGKLINIKGGFANPHATPENPDWTSSGLPVKACSAP